MSEIIKTEERESRIRILSQSRKDLEELGRDFSRKRLIHCESEMYRCNKCCLICKKICSDPKCWTPNFLRYCGGRRTDVQIICRKLGAKS